MGPVTASVIRGFLADGTAFSSGKAAASYVGMNPSTWSSGTVCVCQSDLAPLGGLVLARCGPTLDQPFPSTFGSSATAIRKGEGCEGEIESGAVRRYPT
jgi:hypothetical protein